MRKRSPAAMPRGAGLHLVPTLLCLLLGLAGTVAEAHKPSDSYLTLTVHGQDVRGRWDIALRDIDFAMGLDSNGDGNITWGELRARHQDIAAYALPRLTLLADGKKCALHTNRHLVDTHSDGTYEVLYFAADCTPQPRVLRVDYHLFFDLDPQHKGLLALQTNGVTRTAIFGESTATQQF